MTQNYGVDTQLSVSSRNGNRNRRAPVEFNTSSIPASSTIENASLRLYLQTRPANPRTYNAHRLTNSWLEGNSNGGVNNAGINGVTWIERQFGNNVWTGTGPWDWAAQGGDFLGAPTASTSTPAAVGWMNWNVAADVGAWVSGTAANYGWLIKDAAENSGVQQRGRFASRENGNAGLNPALAVTYLRAGSTLSTGTAQTGWYGRMKVFFTNSAGAGGDQVHQVSFIIPAGWSNISTSTAGYTILAPVGKTWNITSVPAGPNGPQTVTITAATGASDLADGQTVEIDFNARAPWLSGNSIWPSTAYGAAGGTHIPVSRTVNVTGTTLDFTPTIDTSLAAMTLTGVDATTTGNLGALNVRDGRGTGTGWSVVIASTDFRLAGNPVFTIPAAGFTVPVAPAVNTISGQAPPATAAGLLAGAGLTVMNATAGSGMGQYEVVPGLELAVPAQTLSGTYEATMTETIIGL